MPDIKARMASKGVTSCGGRSPEWVDASVVRAGKLYAFCRNPQNSEKKLVLRFVQVEHVAAVIRELPGGAALTARDRAWRSAKGPRRLSFMSSGGDDDVKKLILARRARFVAAAVAMNAVMCGGETDGTSPQPCLSPPCLDVIPAPDGGTPQPCLTPIAPDAGAPDGGDAGVPLPCLSLPAPDAGSS
jgi:hypothetical protein